MNDHLEVIGPSGEVTFFDLGAGTGVTNIGRSPSNTLALPSAGVADYAATLDHRAQPFTLLALTDASPVKVNGRVLRANESADLHEWDSIELDGYVLIVAPGEHMAGTATPAATTSVAPEGVPAVVPAVVPSNGSNGAIAAVAAGAVAAGAVAASTSPAALPATPTDGLTAAGGTVVGTPPSAMIANANLPTLGAPLPQRTDPLIYTTIEDRIQQVDVQVAAQWQFTFSNGSPLVSRFQLSVEGWVDPAWFGFDDNEFTLLERESRSVVLTAVAPRSPMSVAGAHHFVIVIKSDNLPGHEVRMPCTLVINPYYEYAIEPINPLEQTIPWRKRNATFVLPILNKGNSVAHYRIEGSDRENATRIEFPDEARLHLGAREIALNPTQELEVPILVTPFKRRLIGGGGRLYDVTVTTTPMEGVTGPLPTRAGLRHKPLFGRWVLVLLALLIAAALLWIFRPQVMAVRLTYENQAGQLETRLSNADQFAQGTGFLATIQERLGMAAANGSNGNGSGGNGSGGEAAGETEGGEGGAAPALPNLASVSSALSTVGTTALADAVVRAGQPLTVTWETRNGSTVSLGFFGNTETSLVTVDNPASVRRGNFAFVPQPNINPDNTTRGPTIYELRVVNNILSRIPFIGAIGQVNRPLVVEVIPANAPVIQSFVVNTDTAVLGEQVTISWDVTMPNASDSLLLEQRQGDQVVATTPLSNSTGTMTLEPLANTQLRLVPETNLWIGTNPPTAATQNVSVLIPTPTPVPTPDIRAFQIEPQEVIAGNSITITYAISGSTISNLRFFGLPTPQIDLEFPQGRVAVPVPSPGPFNVALVAVRLPDGSTDPADPNAARVTAVASRVAVAPTPTPTPTFTLTPTPTPQVPVIEVLNLSPAEITRGDAAEVLLTWNVIGDMDTISISAPDFTLTSTEKQSSISVPRDATRVFVMTVMLDGEPAASKSVELKVNEPPPPTETPVPPTPVPPTVTPTATSTQVPDPLIISFNVTSDLPVTKEVGPDGNDIFHVAGGAEIIVSWEVQNASTVELRELSSTGDDRTLTKRLAKDQITVNALQDFTYIMTAYNNPADVDVTTAPRSQYGMASRTILVQLNAAQDFDPPTNVQWSRGGDPPGQDNESDPVIVTWEYNPAQTDSILGFRVYKAPAGSSAFVRIADERTLTNTTRTFTDETKPLCGQSYFIVAVYQDLTKPGSDKTVETDAGADSFITPGC